MPKKFVREAAKKGKESVKKVEKEFKTVAKKAKEEGYSKPYAVATAAVEKHTGFKPKKKTKK